MPRLTPEQRADLERQLREDDDAADDYEVEIGQGDNYARVPYGKAKSWLGKTFGIDLDAEPKQDPDGGEDPKQGKGQQGGAQVKAFRSGRRVG